MGKNDFYTRTSIANRDFYGVSQTEINMRKEFEHTLDGLTPEMAKGQPALLRTMRRDSNDKLTKCSCVDVLTKEPDKDRFCPICYGEGQLWDETEILTYRVLKNTLTENSLLDKLHSPGLIIIPVVVFYIRYTAEITIKDKVILIALEKDGTASIPKKRTEVYRIGEAWDYRSDNGKLEYWKLFARKESVKYLNKPSYTEI